MKADRVEVSWDSNKSQWLVRVVVGEEAIRRHSSLPRNADDASLRTTAVQTARDEGYDADPAALQIRR